MKEKFKDKNKQDQVCDLANWLWLLFIISVGVKLLNENKFYWLYGFQNHR